MKHIWNPRPGQALLAAAATVTAAAAFVAVAGSAAHAATSANVRLTNPSNGATVVYDGGAGNANDVRVFREGGQIAVTDTVPITAGAGCRIVAVGKALCDPTVAGRAVSQVFIQLKDLADEVAVETALGGQVFGDDGADRMWAGLGDVRGRSTITYNGGPGRDVVNYGFCPQAVTVTMDDQPNDGPGQFGGGDNVRDDVEQVVGGEFADRLTGDERENDFSGLGGADTFEPGAGRDQVTGGAGDDVFSLRDGLADTASGGSGTDRATADRPLDSLVGIETVS